MSLDINEMQERQRALQAKYAGWWEPVDPEHGRNKLLWMIAEMGEAIQLIKRHSTQEFLEATHARRDFIEEMADVLMYFNDVLICYNISPEEFAAIYREKNEYNMTRWKKPDK